MLLGTICASAPALKIFFHTLLHSSSQGDPESAHAAVQSGQPTRPRPALLPFNTHRTSSSIFRHKAHESFHRLPECISPIPKVPSMFNLQSTEKPYAEPMVDCTELMEVESPRTPRQDVAEVANAIPRPESPTLGSGRPSIVVGDEWVKIHRRAG